jgi:hypothetical protein
MPDNPVQAYNGSVVRAPPSGVMGADRLSDYIMYVANAADRMPPWGTAPRERDRLLREFWTTEPILAGAIFSTVSRYTGFEWDLNGPDRMVNMYTRILHSSQHGYGWQALMMPFVTDYLSQDNGGFMEIIRTADAPTAPVVQLNHLDSNQCTRTGIPETPVVYYDRQGDAHLLKWYQVLMLTEMVSPIERQHGRQVCAVSRVLKAAQLMRDIQQYKRERANGQDSKQIHVVTGVSTQRIDDAINEARQTSAAEGYARFTRAVIVGSINPEAQARVATIDLAKLPEGYDEEKAQKDYITVIAMCFGADYQDYAPLPTGTMGSGAQSEVLAVKARGKGPTLFMRGVEFLMNYHGIMPANVTFTYGNQDAAQDLDNAKLRTLRAEERAMRIKSGEITPDTARELAVAAGDLTQEQADAMKGYVAPVPAPAGQGTRDGGRPKTDMQEGGTPAVSTGTV